MNSSARFTLVALGAALLLSTFLPPMLMGSVPEWLVGSQCDCGAASWLMGSTHLLVLLLAGALIVAGLRRR